MAAPKLARGMGTFFKDCEHPESRWSKCPHEYTIRYRNPAGRQTEESGFARQDRAIERLTEIYNEKRAASARSQSKAERIQKYGTMRFEEYTEEWKAGQRHLAVSSLRHLDSLLEHHLYPALASRRMNSFDHKVVDGFIRTMERAGAGLATQANAFDKLRAILLDAHRLGIYSENPVAGVKPPQYDPARAVIPSLEQLHAIRTAGDDAFTLIVDLMSGCGLRNGEAAAVNLKNIVADDVYRVSEQVILSTRRYGPLKHRKAGTTVTCLCPHESGRRSSGTPRSTARSTATCCASRPTPVSLIRIGGWTTSGGGSGHRAGWTSRKGWFFTATATSTRRTA